MNKAALRPDFSTEPFTSLTGEGHEKSTLYLSAAVLTLKPTEAAYAGRMETTAMPPGKPGQMDTTPSTYTSDSIVTVETLASIALDIYQSMKP